jgi:flagellar biosynthesis regulator FlaF
MWSVIVDADSYLQILWLTILRDLGALVGNTLLNTTSRARVIIILVTVTKHLHRPAKRNVRFLVCRDTASLG